MKIGLLLIVLLLLMLLLESRSWVRVVVQPGDSPRLLGWLALVIVICLAYGSLAPPRPASSQAAAPAPTPTDPVKSLPAPLPESPPPDIPPEEPPLPATAPPAYAIQVGAYLELANAQRQQALLAAQTDEPVEVTKLVRENGVFYRVTVGRYHTPALAADALRHSSLSGIIVHLNMPPS